MKKDKEVKEVCCPKVKPTLTLSEKDVSGISGKSLGDSCKFMVEGKITSARTPYEGSEDKDNQYTVEITKIENYGSKRV